MKQLRSTAGHWLFLTIVFAVCISGFSQERKLLGRVLDKDTQKPIKNVNVIIFGTTSGTVSNHLGYFELTIDPSKDTKLIASHVGYANTDVPITAEDKFRFSMLRVYTKLPDLHLDNFPKDYIATVRNQTPSGFGASGMGIAESQATFPGGVNNFISYLGLALAKEISNVPENGIGAIFTIDPTGKATNINFTDSTSTFREHVTRALAEMPAWTPATQRQIPVSQDFVVPIFAKSPQPDGSLLAGFHEFFRKEVRYPVQARRMGIAGAVLVQFELDFTGRVTNLNVVKDIGADCGDEVVNVLARMPPVLLKPLLETGHTKFLLPVNFGLTDKFETSAITATDDAYALEHIDVVVYGLAREHKMTGYGSVPTGYTPNLKAEAAPAIYYSLNDALKSKKKAEGLVLAGKQLTFFPAEILRLENLKFLDLESNLIRYLPEGIGSLASLQELYLNHNDIEVLPKGFANLRELKVLGLASNQMKVFPGEITGHEKLVGLDISNNQLSSLPAEIGQLKELEVLSIANNSISIVPNEFFRLSKLKQLDISGNPLDSAVLQRLRLTFPTITLVNTVPNPQSPESSGDTFTVVEESAAPAGGMGVFYSIIKKNMKYPVDARKLGIDGKVFLEFVVDKDGSIPPESIKVVKGLSPSLDAEAVRLIRVSPKWLPGRQRGQPVKQRMVLPITFTLG